jgi:hypothetical protein
LVDVEAMEAELEAPVRRRLSPLMAAAAVAAARRGFASSVVCAQGYDGTDVRLGPLRVERTITR